MKLSFLSTILCRGTALASRCKPSYPLSASHVTTSTQAAEPSTSTSILVPGSSEAVSYDTAATWTSTLTSELMSSSVESTKPTESSTIDEAVSSTEVLSNTEIFSSTEAVSSTAVINSTEAAVSSLSTIITEILPSTTKFDAISASTSAEATTTSAPPQPTNITGFCLKLSSTSPQLQNLIMTSGSPISNHLVYPVGVPNYSLFNIDTRTGVLSMNNTNPGFVVMAPPPFSSQTMRVLRHYPPSGDATGDISAPLICNDPLGQYTSGSVFSCSATSVLEPVTTVFNTFRTSTLAGVFAMQLFREDQGVASRFVYQLAMFFGDECTTRM